MKLRFIVIALGTLLYFCVTVALVGLSEGAQRTHTYSILHELTLKGILTNSDPVQVSVLTIDTAREISHSRACLQSCVWNIRGPFTTS